ncbi:MAG: hypothetical protein HYV35_11535 [Lentisphaerae bacterium]|nr:hypothetical protein [Lentisphaerota bacterium]
MASVYFKCACEQSLALAATEAGRQVQCPNCGRSIAVPSAQVFWKCACGEEMAAPDNLAGAVLLCAACKAEHTVPVRLRLKSDQPRPAESPANVPKVPASRLIQCPQCGYMFATTLERCPRCQHYWRKERAILRQVLVGAKVVLIVALGWLLAAYFEQLKRLCQEFFGRLLE